MKDFSITKQEMLDSICLIGIILVGVFFLGWYVGHATVPPPKPVSSVIYEPYPVVCEKLNLFEKQLYAKCRNY
jgi:hypothetical protein